MYETFFGLERRPFLAVPDTGLYFPTLQMEEARLSIERTVRRGEGISLVFGQAGVGKSLLLRMLKKSLERDFDIILLTSGRIADAKSFLQTLLHELKLPFSGADETELRLILADYICSINSFNSIATPNESAADTTDSVCPPKPQGILLLIDEAQFISQITIEEIRLLMNNDNGAVPFCRAVLAGTSEFEDRLTLPQFESFNQRVVTRIYLDKLSQNETSNYVTWQTGLSKAHSKIGNNPDETSDLNFTDDSLQRDISADLGVGFDVVRLEELPVDLSGKADIRRMDLPHVDYSETIFSDEAKYEVYRLTEGLPRLINQVCDAAMQLASQQAVSNIDEIQILAAWGKLQQIKSDVDSATRTTNSTKKPKAESIDEIVERKKGTVQIKKFNSTVEFGTLDDESKSTDHKIQHVYKPPYPDDDFSEKLKESTANDKSTAHNNLNQTETGIAAVENINAEIKNNFGNDLDNDIDSRINGDVSDALGIDDEEIDEGLICFELSTSLISSDVQVNVPEKSLSKMRSQLRLIYPVQRRLYASQSMMSVKRIFGVGIFVRFGLAACAEDAAVGNNFEIFKRFYCYKKPSVNCGVLSLRQSAIYRNKNSTCIHHKFTMWHNRFVHAWIGNAVSRSLLLSTTFITTAANHGNLYENKLNEDTKITDSNFDTEESEMDRESLKKYGETVLNCRPPFVRREPVYVYKTTNQYYNQSQNPSSAQFDQDEETTQIFLNTTTKNTADNVENFAQTITENSPTHDQLDETHDQLDDTNSSQNTNQKLSLTDNVAQIDSGNENYVAQIDSSQLLALWTNPDKTSKDIINVSFNESESTCDVPDKNEKVSDIDANVSDEPAESQLRDEFADQDISRQDISGQKISGQNSPVVFCNSELPRSLAGADVELVYGEILLNWVNKQYDSEHGFGTAYREFVLKHCGLVCGAVEVGSDLFGGIVPVVKCLRTSIDERFDETVHVNKTTITLDEVYRTVRNFHEEQCSKDAISNAERQIAATLERLTQAAEKIELAAANAEIAGRKAINAAKATEEAGQKLKSTASLVEEEVKTNLPSYKDLFSQLAEFHKTISDEVQLLQIKQNKYACKSVLPFPPQKTPEKVTQSAEKRNTGENAIDIKTLFQ
ncbi:MAG: AAA family ATPase [Planctomycetaceae bacterium]|nr:AAA family ATPase [Planctomycetaceae bacterium]